MVLGSSFVLGVLAAVSLPAAMTRFLARLVEARYPPAGHFVNVDGIRLHYIEEKSQADYAESPAIFLHGAGGNARDLHSAMAGNLHLLGRAIFVDRPGAGYSGALQPEDVSIERQADLVVGLMDELGLEKAIVVGHSLGGAVALAMAANFPGRVASLVLVAPATHPWRGGKLSWYYRIAKKPSAGWLFIETLAIPIGHFLYRRTVRQIFEPDSIPANYFHASATQLILRPANFRNNARDVAALYGNLWRLSQRYREIAVPVTIVTGDCDGVVAPREHAFRLAAEMPDTRLIVLDDTGHMPLHMRPDLVANEILRFADDAEAQRKPASKQTLSA
jgi:pimeloyl-ACP methyl ester carboxylesterase